MDIIAFSSITSFDSYVGLGTIRCMHALIGGLMNSRLDRRVVIRFILRYHNLYILTSSSLPLISHVTISVLYPYPLYAISCTTLPLLPFLWWFSTFLCTEDGHIFSSFHPLGSDPGILVLRGCFFSEDS